MEIVVAPACAQIAACMMLATNIRLVRIPAASSSLAATTPFSVAGICVKFKPHSGQVGRQEKIFKTDANEDFFVHSVRAK